MRVYVTECQENTTLMTLVVLRPLKNPRQMAIGQSRTLKAGSFHHPVRILTQAETLK